MSHSPCYSLCSYTFITFHHHLGVTYQPNLIIIFHPWITSLSTTGYRFCLLIHIHIIITIVSFTQISLLRFIYLPFSYILIIIIVYRPSNHRHIFPHLWVTYRSLHTSTSLAALQEAPGARLTRYRPATSSYSMSAAAPHAHGDSLIM